MQLPHDRLQSGDVEIVSEGRKAGKVRMYTTRWCPDCWRAKQLLKRHGIEFEEINIEEAPDAVEFIMSVNSGRRKVPTFEIEGRAFSSSPFDPARVKRELGIE